MLQVFKDYRAEKSYSERWGYRPYRTTPLTIIDDTFFAWSRGLYYVILFMGWDCDFEPF